MRFEEYLDWIEKAETVEELSEIAEKVRRDPELTEAQKTTLLSIYIGRKRKEIGGSNGNILG